MSYKNNYNLISMLKGCPLLRFLSQGNVAEGEVEEIMGGGRGVNENGTSFTMG